MGCYYIGYGSNVEAINLDVVPIGLLLFGIGFRLGRYCFG